MYYLHRTLCDVLDEMRKCYETRNFCSLNGLIEEAQSMGNRMEAALEDSKSIKNLQEEVSKLNKEVKKLEAKKKKLGGKKAKKELRRFQI